jgi:hypothetical protein
MADSVTPDDVDVFLDNAARGIRSIYHTVLKASKGAALFGQDMLFDIPFIADWNKIGDCSYRQHHTAFNIARENIQRVDYEYKIGDKVLVLQDGILHKAQSPYSKKHGL